MGGSEPRPFEAVVVDYAYRELPDCLATILPLPGLRAVHVVDNHGSTQWDEVAEVAGPLLRRHEFEGNAGFGGGVNRGAAAVEAGHLLLLNPDARIEDWDVQALLAAMEARGAWVAAPWILDRRAASWGDLMTVRDLLRRAARRPSRSKRIDQPDPGELLEVGWVSGVCLLADVRVFRDLGGFDPAYFLYYEDQDLCRAVHAAGHAVLKSGDGRIVHASHGTMGTEWRRKLRNYRSLVRFLVRPRRRPSP